MGNEEEALIAAKLECIEGESDEEHAVHAESLAAAYLAFQQRSGDVIEGEQAEGDTPIETHVIVTSEFNPPPPEEPAPEPAPE